MIWHWEVGKKEITDHRQIVPKYSTCLLKKKKKIAK